MRILIITDPYIPVPPAGYGGVERLVELLAIEYINQGHHVTLLAGPGSKVKGSRLHIYGKNLFPPDKKTKLNAVWGAWRFLLTTSSKKYDYIINFGRLLYLFPWLNKRVKKISCYGREISSSNVKLAFKLPHRNFIISGCSNNLIQRSGVGHLCTYVYNFIDFNKYTLAKDFTNEGYLFFLGRLEKVKGVHNAIEVAKKTNHVLVIAGNISPLPEEIQYYENEIRPKVDGKQIVYVGEVNDQQKNHWLGNSKATLFPIEWNEPFGMVMIESMACGTPVIAFERGSVGEVIDQNITGLKVKTVEEMCSAVMQVHLIDRTKCRTVAEERFSVKKIADQYLSLFELKQLQ
jgi:glycosyltransferase involved in cell wall biosynthesis